MRVDELVNKGRKRGLVGLEIECEGDNLIAIDNDWWRSEADSSLKKADSWEYVLKEPLSLAEVSEAVDQLYSILEENDASIDESVRAGVHVHINVQDMSVVELFSFITLYILLEEVLVSYCGENRQGNLFCLRASDARYLIRYMMTNIQSKQLSKFHTDDIRYASINLKALYQYGSLEFRAMRSTPDKEAIITWINLLTTVREASKKFRSPDDVVYNLSDLGVDSFIREVFGKLSPFVMGTSDLHGKVRRGLDNAQDVAYCVDWSKYDSGVSTNPFLRGEFT